ncbi:hypothetical protein AHAS_Ahas14G0178600 [Arachis hypogaea]
MDFFTRLAEEGGTNGSELPEFETACACKPNVSASNRSKALLDCIVRVDPNR